MFRKPMQMRSLENYGVPSYIIDIWEENYSTELLPVQEEAVKNYGILDYGCSKGLPRRFTPRNDINNNLMVISPTSSGKTFIGEMAAITQAIHKKKFIYLVPLRSLAEEKYYHFKDLYADCNINIYISSRDRREYDKRIIRGDYQGAVMVYEKFNYFLHEFPDFLRDVSLVIIDEMQMIHDFTRGPLLENTITAVKMMKPGIKLIGLSAFLENETGFLNWMSADALISYQRPVELRKGYVRNGTFKYITHNRIDGGEETFFSPGEVQDNSFEDYLYETVSYFIKNDEPTLFFLPTKKETRKWAGWCCQQIDAPRAENAIAELSRLEETRSRNELLYLLEKGIAYHNADLSWEERNIVETYLRKGEIKLICSTTTLAMGINLPFKNVILTVNKYTYDNTDCKRGYLTNLTPTEAENMGGRAGRLNRKEKDSFGRVVFLAHSMLLESILLNLFFSTMKPLKLTGTPLINDPANPYNRFLQSDTASSFFPVKKELHFMNFLLREIGRGINTEEKLKKQLKKFADENQENDRYWKFYFEKNVFKRTDIGEYLEQLTEMGLVKMNVKDADVFVLTDAGMLVHSRGLDINTYLFFKKYLETQSGKMSDLEIITLLAKSDAGKNVSIPYPQFNQVNDRYNYGAWKYVYQGKMKKLVSDCGEEDKKIYADILEQGTEKYRLNIDDYLSMKKALLLYEWIGDKEVKEIEEEYKIYGGAIQKIGESFSWLAECLAAVAKSLGWDKEEKKKEKIVKIRILSERLAQGLQEEELKIARLHIPGLSKYYIKLLQREGYGDQGCLEELSEKELSKVLPKRIAGRIKKRFLQDKKRNKKKNSYELPRVSVEVKTKNRVEEEPSLLSSLAHSILEIDKRRPDRIIFEGKETKVTAKEFSLIYLLAQNNNQVMTYDALLDELWKDEEDAIYNRVSFHISKIRRTILKGIGKSKINEEKLKNIFVVVPKRGVILKLKSEEIKIT